MRENKLHTPAGVRDLLPCECSIKLEIIRKITSVFKSYGYNYLETPTFEYIDVFSDEKMEGTIPQEMYKFFDRDGSILVLRPDMTPAIARVAATAYSDYRKPLRFSYIGNIFRYNKNYKGKQREFTQAGIELMGVDSVDADAEVIAIAVNSLLAVGLKEFKIVIGQVEFFKSMLEESGLEGKTRNRLQYLIAKRDYVGAEEIIKQGNMKESIKRLFLELPRLTGLINVIEYARSFIENKNALNALLKMEKLYETLKLYNIEKYISFDLGMVNHLEYYTGIIFRAYTYGTGYSVIDGGRYDNLVEDFGMKTPSTGFGVKISELMAAIRFHKIDIEAKNIKHLFSYSKNGKKTAFEMADKYRKNGFLVEISLLGEDLDENISYAKYKGMSHVLYFSDNNNVKLVSLLDELGGYTLDITVDDLINQKEEG